MNARSIVVGFVLSLSLSLACDEQQEQCDPRALLPYMPCDDECINGGSRDGEQFCLFSPPGTAQMCSPTCEVDADCPTLDREGGATQMHCIDRVCALPCEGTMDCPLGLVCAGGMCLWGEPSP